MIITVTHNELADLVVQRVYNKELDRLKHRHREVLASNSHTAREEYYNEARAVSVSTNNREVRSVMAWANAVTELASKVTSVLGERSIPVAWATGTAVACTDGETIYIGTDWFINKIVPSILNKNLGQTVTEWSRFKAIAYHELSHILWTPRWNSKLISTLRNEPFNYRVWNAIEDARIESFFVGRYAPAIPHFTRAVIEDCLDLNGHAGGQKIIDIWRFLLSTGRKYLPSDLRDRQRNDAGKWLSTSEVETLAQLIDRYRVLIFPADTDEALSIVTKIVEILGQNGCDADNTPNPSGEHVHRKGNAPRAGEQREALEQAQDAEEEGFGFGDPDDDDDDLDESDEDTEGNGDGEGEESDSSDDSSDADDSDGAQDSDSDSDSDGAGSGQVDDDSVNPDREPGDSNDGTNGGRGVSRGNSESGDNNDSPVDDLLEHLNDLDDVAINEGRETIKTLRNMIDRLQIDAFRNAKLDRGRVASFPVQPWMRTNRRLLTDAIGRVFAECEDYWERGFSSGRLNVRDAMSARSTHFDVFESWNEANEDATSFEVVVLLDRSGSMTSPISRDYRVDTTWTTLSDLVSQSLWVLKSAFDSLNIPVTVIGYNDEASLVMKPGTSCDNQQWERLPATGGTNAAQALAWAGTIFSSSRAANKMLFSLTDGDWWMADEIVRNAEAVRSTGASTTLVSIGSTTAVHSLKHSHRTTGLYFGHESHIHFTAGQLTRFARVVGEHIISTASNRVQVAV